VTILEAKGITKRFGGLVAVNKLDVTIDEGEILGMIGPNGAGKTTAFNMISGFYEEDEGEVFFRGEDITHLRPDQICKKGLARTFQVVKPFPQISVLENVMVGAYNHTADERVAKERAQEILNFLGMTDQAEQLAGSLPTAGRKRLELARALATDPKLLLLDEVMGGLRPTEINEMITLVRKTREQGVSLLLVEHVMKVIMSLADRIVVIHHGEKIAEDVPEMIVRNRAVIDAYLGEVKTSAER
jgi:branched-chain amino acid transport system ATP-binding protein